MIETEEQARAYCSDVIEASAVRQLETLSELLARENARQNLVSDLSLAHVWQRHFADSLQLAQYWPSETSLLDLGSGAGFPGLVLAIARPESEVVLVESRRKRCEWLQAAAAELGLRRCRVLPQRLEVVESFAAGAISARAFAPLGKLLKLSARFSTPSTAWLLPKGRSAGQELSEQPDTIRSMFHVKQSITDPSGGILIGRGKPDIL